MGAVVFYIFYAINWVITLLPMPVLYFLSDILYLILRYGISYRKKTVRENLRNSFPAMTPGELKNIERKFYRHLADIFIETASMMHMNRKQFMERIRFTNPDLLERLYAEGRDIAAVIGHYNNWEWMKSVMFCTKYSVVSIYKPLQDKRFDRLVRRIREKGGMVMTPMSNVIRKIAEARKANRRTLYTFITDQSPRKSDAKYWMNFLNQETAVYKGVEKIAAKYDMVIVYFNMQKIRRGYYECTAEILVEHPALLDELAITERHVRKLEEMIREKPEYWAWSHRRWKHKREEGE